MKKALILFLGVLLFLLSFAGCGGSKQGNNQTVQIGNSESALPEMKWEGRELKVIERNSDIVESVIASEDTSTPIGYEVYARNAEITARYDFDITTKRVSASTISERVSEQVRTQANAGECSYDLVVDSPSYMKGALFDFIFADLNSVKYLDLSFSGWDQKANSELSVCGYQFVCTGDLNLLEKSGSSVIFCNRDMLESLTDEDVRQTVLDHEWTIEKMTELMELANRIDYSTANVEVYGLVNQGNSVFVNFMTSSCGMTIASKNDLDIPSLSFDDAAYFQLTDGWVDRILSFYANQELTYNQRYSGTKPNAMDDLFKQNRALFYGGVLGNVIDLQQNATFTYSTFPYPINDLERQTEYYAARNYADSGLMAIPCFASDPDFSAFALQAMNERSGKLMHHFVEEKCKIRGSVDQIDYQLMTLAIANSTYDIGVVYDWGGLKTWIFIDRYDDNTGYSIPLSGSNDFAILWQRYKDLAHKELQELIDSFNQD